MIDLPPVDGAPWSFANSVTDEDQVVGNTSDTSSNELDAVLWTGGHAYDRSDVQVFVGMREMHAWGWSPKVTRCTEYRSIERRTSPGVFVNPAERRNNKVDNLESSLDNLVHPADGRLTTTRSISGATSRHMPATAPEGGGQPPFFFSAG